MKYVMMLRGINIGGNKTVKMSQLAETLVSLKLQNVKTILNSGNVVFQSIETDSQKLKDLIAEKLEQTFGWTIEVFIYSMEDIQKIIKTEPFKKIKVEKNTRLYVTFFNQLLKSSLKLPYISEKKDFEILSQNNFAVFWILTVLKPGQTGDGMKVIEKEYGRNSTTRNWNTLVRISNF